jgi:uncharacterized protein
MSKAFNYGKIVEDDFFTDREKETEWLINQIKNGINCSIIAPRRWGKSSLVNKVAQKMNSKKIKFCFIDLFNIRTEEEFINTYGSQILKATANTTEEVLKNIKAVIKGIIPEISVGSDASGMFEVSFNVKDQKKQLSEILDLPEKIAKEKNIQVVVCIDEFQNVSYLNDGLAWQKKLRAHWQKHQSCNYILYGSRKHLMLEFFTNNSMPFYKFGETLFLEKIAANYWVPFIIERFKTTGKKIDAALAEDIAITMKEHPYFVQQLAMVVWQNTVNVASKKILQESLQDLFDQYNILYQKTTEELTNQQINFLKILCLKIENISSKEVLQKFNIGTSANIIRMRESLEKKELIDIIGKQITINDPLYEMWLLNRYFKITI